MNDFTYFDAFVDFFAEHSNIADRNGQQRVKVADGFECADEEFLEAKALFFELVY